MTRAARLSRRDVHRDYRAGRRTPCTPCAACRSTSRAASTSPIVGPSGCGKSTLLNLLGAIDRPTRGTVTIDGTAVSAMRDREATRFRLTHIGFVFQRFYLMPALTRSRERRAADGRGAVSAQRATASARASC